MKIRFLILMLFTLIPFAFALGGCGGGGDSGGSSSFGLSAIASGPSQVDLSWESAPGSVSGYWVYRDGNPIHDTILNGTSISDRDTIPNTKYCYIVKAVTFPVGVTGQSNMACVETPGLASGWKLSTLVGQGNLGGRPAIAIDSLDNIHIAYVDTGIKYLTNKSGVWMVSTIEDNVDVYKNYSIALDSSDNVHIIYNDSTNNIFNYATNESGTWTYYKIDSPGSDCSIAIDSSDKVHISSIGWPANYFYTTNTSGSWMTTFIMGYSGATPGPTSIAVDSTNTPHISFTLQGADTGYLYYATNASGLWTESIIANSAIGNSASSIIVDATNRIYISYSKSQPFQLSIAYYDLNNWSISSIEDQDWIGGDTSIARDKADGLHIGYCDFNDLKYATNVSGSWSTYFIDSVGDVGSYNSIAVDSFGKAHIVYYDSTNKVIKLASKD